MKQKTCAEILAEIGEKIDNSPVLKAACIYSDSVKKPATIYGYGKVGLIEAFKSGAEWQAKQSSWINITEQLPNEDEIVLCRMKSNGAIVSGYIFLSPEGYVCVSTSPNFEFEDYGGYECDMWMPIPKFNE